MLTVYWWIKHHGLDVCVYISALYAFTSFCSVAIVLGDLVDPNGGILFDKYDLEMGITPTLLYCVLITMGIFPFSLIYNREIKQVESSSSLVLEGFCWVLFFVFLINIYLIADSTIEILSGDLSTVRMDHYNGIQSPAEIKAQNMPVLFKYILYLRQTTILALPLFFYYNCFSKKQWWFKAMLIAISLTVPLFGLQMADRTEFTLYGMMFIFCLVFFKKYLTKRFKIKLAIIGSPFILAILIYIVAVSQARFAKGGDNNKAYAAALQYAGQNYLNFCYFWEHAKTDHITAEREFPFIYHTLMHIDSDPERRSERSGEQGFFISVFPSFAGDIMLDLSVAGALIWFVLYFFICIALIRYAHREVYDIGDILAIFVLSAIPIFGIFYYKFYNITYSYLIISTSIIYLFTKVNVVYK